MARVRRCAATLAASFATAILASSLADAAQRTFVATYGGDSNDCVVSAPCRSFSAALTRTDADGEIVVLDSGGYGRVTIDRSVSITAPTGVYAGIAVFAGTNGVDVVAPGAVVALRGLTINGQGGNHGIAFTQGAVLHVERCTVVNMAMNGLRLATGDVYVSNVAVIESGGSGIYADSVGKLAIEGTRIERNANAGLAFYNGASLTVTNSVLAGNGGAGAQITSNDGATQTAAGVSASSVSQNGGAGVMVSASNAGSKVRIGIARNLVAGNASTGLSFYSVNGYLNAMITRNTVERNGGSGGILASGSGVVATITANAVSGNDPYGVKQQDDASLDTARDNVVRRNVMIDVYGTVNPVSAD